MGASRLGAAGWPSTPSARPPPLCRLGSGTLAARPSTANAGFRTHQGLVAAPSSSGGRREGSFDGSGRARFHLVTRRVALPPMALGRTAQPAFGLPKVYPKILGGGVDLLSTMPSVERTIPASGAFAPAEFRNQKCPPMRAWPRRPRSGNASSSKTTNLLRYSRCHRTGSRYPCLVGCPLAPREHRSARLAQ
jgi:hypothetical protein